MLGGKTKTERNRCVPCETTRTRDHRSAREYPMATEPGGGYDSFQYTCGCDPARRSRSPECLEQRASLRTPKAARNGFMMRKVSGSSFGNALRGQAVRRASSGSLFDEIHPDDRPTGGRTGMKNQSRMNRESIKEVSTMLSLDLFKVLHREIRHRWRLYGPRRLAYA